jgi:DNA-binding IclR family transcriptional regulator
MQTTVSKALLIAVFRSARSGRRPNLTAFCKRARIGAAELQRAFDQLEQSGLLSFAPAGERLTLEGLAVAAALSRSASARHRPLAACRALAA